MVATARLLLANSAVAVPHTGDTNETTLATYTLAANAMGVNGLIIIDSIWSFTGSTNAKTFRVKFGGTNYQTRGETSVSNLSNRNQAIIQNRGATNSQVGGPVTAAFGPINSAPVTTSVDTTAAVTILLTGQLASSGETITLESYNIWLFR